MYQSIYFGIFLFLLVFFQGSWASASAAPAAVPYPPDIAAIKKQGVLTVAIYSANQAPFTSQDAKGNWSGMDVDFANMIASQLGVKLQIKPAPTFNAVVDMVASGQANLGMGLLSITPGRALLVRFTNPYYTFHPYLLVNRLQLEQQGWTLDNAVDEIQNSHTPLKIAALASSANIALLQEALPQAKIIPYSTPDATLQAVASGQVFAAISDTPEQLKHWLQQNPQAAVTTGMAMVNSRIVLFGIALSWNEEGLRQWLNVYINYLQMNNLLQDLFDQYNIAQGLGS